MSGKKSLADKISGLLNAAPSYNPDENDAEIAAKVVDYDEVEQDEEGTIKQSAFRKKNVSLLEEVDAKYAGKKSSRKDLYDSDEEDDSLSLECIDQESDSGTEDEEGSEDMDLDNDEEDGSEEVSGDEEEQVNFRHMNETNLNVINQKGQCVQNQIQMWENLLEMRIQLQKCLVASNKLPGVEGFREMKTNNEFKEKSESVMNILMGAVGNMIDLQELLIEKFPESKNILKDTKLVKKVADGNEIPSDAEDEEEYEVETEESKDKNKQSAKRKKYAPIELEQRAVRLHKNYTTFRNTTIQKWNDKTQIAHGKTANTNPVLKQIEFNLTDKPRLIRRTQLKRSEYRILGENLQDSNAGNNPEEDQQQKTNEHEYNNNIFDDDDFYHQLLRELIEVKSADITDPVQLSRQWIQLQNLRSKMKRKIDTRATKGRKMRFGVHTKLVNFMAPINNELITGEAQTELFSSLFGKRG